MITAFSYTNKDTLTTDIINADNIALVHTADWIDVYCPSAEEEALLEQSFTFNLPSREEMLEIELSSRLRKTPEALIMTVTLVSEFAATDTHYDAVTFLLTKKRLITVRYIEHPAFKLFEQELRESPPPLGNPVNLLIYLIDACIERLADLLEVVSHNLDKYSRSVFYSEEEAKKLNYRGMLQQVGATGDLNAKARESLLTFNRLITFLKQNLYEIQTDGVQLSLETFFKDINALSDQANFISNKIIFLLEATLGLVNIEQNNIIKIFSVAAVIFLPPTLIASIYGMNFKVIPELSWVWGYPLALILMIFSGWLPYKYFKRKKWL